MLRCDRIMSRFQEITVKASISSKWCKSMYMADNQRSQPHMTVARTLQIGSENLPQSKDRQALFCEDFGHENKAILVSVSRACQYGS